MRVHSVPSGSRRSQSAPNLSARPAHRPAFGCGHAGRAEIALDEPYRTTVLLRFFEDLPPRRVAARMGVPVETVRSRVQRAVTQLRSRLDPDGDGRGAAWCLLLPAGRRVRVVPGAAATAVAIGGTVKATTWTATAIALLLAAAATTM